MKKCYKSVIRERIFQIYSSEILQISQNERVNYESFSPISKMFILNLSKVFRSLYCIL